jgi:hypothetical protein
VGVTCGRYRVGSDAARRRLAHRRLTGSPWEGEQPGRAPSACAVPRRGRTLGARPASWPASPGRDSTRRSSARSAAIRASRWPHLPRITTADGATGPLKAKTQATTSLPIRISFSGSSSSASEARPSSSTPSRRTPTNRAIRRRRRSRRSSRSCSGCFRA